MLNGDLKMFPIGAVERDTGIGRDTLRIWERRYGFPVPDRNTKGDRVYSDSQVRILQLIKRLLDHGIRPGKVVGLPETELQQLIQDKLSSQKAVPEHDANIQQLLNLVAQHESKGFWNFLEKLLLQQGLQSFIIDTVVPLVSVVGDKWAKGDFLIYEEHFVTRQLTQFLDVTMSKLPLNTTKNPVLLATLPGEMHSLGILMLECLMRNQEISVINLGTEMPMDQISLACRKYQAKAIMLSFSGSYNSNTIRNELIELSERIDDQVLIYVGGSGVKRMRKLPEQIVMLQKLEEVINIK
jgi:DNA-binding transcriptional MerR regulator/methylmalonyl-CoA mutase cobalamin-binding subunit